MTEATRSTIVIVFLGVVELATVALFLAAIFQRDDLKNMLWSVRFYAYHPAALTAEDRLSLIKDALEGKALENSCAEEAPE